MEKAWDIKILEAELKAKGLPALEGMAELVVDAVYSFGKKSVELEDSLVVKTLASPLVELFGPTGLIKSMADKIDGVEG